MALGEGVPLVSHDINIHTLHCAPIHCTQFAPQHIHSLKRMVMSSTEFSWLPSGKGKHQFDDRTTKQHVLIVLLRDTPKRRTVSYPNIPRGTNSPGISNIKLLKVGQLPTQMTLVFIGKGLVLEGVLAQK